MVLLYYYYQHISSAIVPSTADDVSPSLCTKMAMEIVIVISPAHQRLSLLTLSNKSFFLESNYTHSGEAEQDRVGRRTHVRRGQEDN